MNRQQAEAAERVRRCVDDDARVVGLEMASGFGRLQTMAHVAGLTFADRKALLVVGRTWLLDRAVEAVAQQAPGRKVGLLGTGADVEVVTLKRALKAAREGRVLQDLIVVDETEPDQKAEVDALVDACGDASIVLHVAPPDPGGIAIDPETFSFPVNVIRHRERVADPDPGPMWAR